MTTTEARPARATRAARTPIPGAQLTDREADVLRLIAQGHTNNEIASALFVTEDTVKTHGRRLYRKLGARDRAHAVSRGYEIGLLAVTPVDERRQGDTHVVGCPALTPPPRCQCRFGEAKR